MRRLFAALVLALPLAALAQPPAHSRPFALSDADKTKAAAVVDHAVAYLKSQQDPKAGGWNVNPTGPTFPAITGLAVMGLRANDTLPATDPAIKKAVDFILSKQQPDGGIYDTILPSYNTAICISALAQSGDPRAKPAIEKAVAFLKSLQFGEGAVKHEGLDDSAEPVTKENPFYGGWGYGHSGRPDLSNTAWALEALHDAGVDSSDAAFQRALVFLQRCQMLDHAPGGAGVNDLDFAAGSKQGGFIYSTSPNKDKAGEGISYAGTIEESLDDGAKVSRLRAYGTMSYSGFKSYLYAGLAHDDPRVAAARNWIAQNYTLAENPNMGDSGLYYYFVVFARALRADGSPTVPGTPEGHAWRPDLIHRLAELQQPDGSFKSLDKRWMEDNPVLITAYSLVAIQQAR